MPKPDINDPNGPSFGYKPENPENEGPHRQVTRDSVDPKEAAPFTDIGTTHSRRTDIDLANYRDLGDSGDESQQLQIDATEHGTGIPEGNERDNRHSR